MRSLVTAPNVGKTSDDLLLAAIAIFDLTEMGLDEATHVRVIDIDGNGLHKDTSKVLEEIFRAYAQKRFFRQSRFHGPLCFTRLD